jgi:hypothetical protein
MNTKRGAGEKLVGFIVVPEFDDPGDVHGFAPMMAEPSLRYGIVVTHTRREPHGWVTPVLAVWYVTTRPKADEKPEREARRGSTDNVHNARFD